MATRTAQVQQRCHFTSMGFGTILEIREISQTGLRTKITTKLKIQFDTGRTLWKSLSEVELI